MEHIFQHPIHDSKERLKELSCINQTTQILRSGLSIEETFHRLLTIIPQAWQFNEYAVARICYNGKQYVLSGFKESPFVQSQSFQTKIGKSGFIEVFYIDLLLPDEHMPVFLKEEQMLIDNLSTLLVGFLDGMETHAMLSRNTATEQRDAWMDYVSEQKHDFDTRQLLQRFLRNQNTIINTLHDLMPFRVKEIMLIGTLYDTFAIETDGRFSEHILSDYYQSSITEMPRITGVTTTDEALVQLVHSHFDLVIILGGGNRNRPFSITAEIKEKYPYLPVFLLLTDTKELQYIKSTNMRLHLLDKIFVRTNTNNAVFFAMIKYLEDKMNVENDTQVGLIKVILLVEDSEAYYSKYIPLLFESVKDQTRKLVEEVNSDSVTKRLQSRLRPKILLAENYEEAMEIVHHYRDNLMCLITDVEFPKAEVVTPDAGFQLTQALRDEIPDLPVIIQSSDKVNSHKAFEIKASFINKDADTLLREIKSFINHQMSIGAFVYRDGSGKRIMSVRTLQEFEMTLETIPDDSLVYHAKRNHFSLWLMARGEIKIAKMIYLIKVTDFTDLEEYRSYMLFVIRRHRNESSAGKVVDFDDQKELDDTNIMSLSSGNLGGKGKGLSFVNMLIYNLNFSNIVPDIQIKTPRTAVIATDEFDIFMDKNNLRKWITDNSSFESLQSAFLKGDLSYRLVKRLQYLLKDWKKPLAVRSSSLLEDSSAQPFSGVFSTYLLPNNHPDLNVRVQQVMDAIKLVYASMYTPDARDYFRIVQGSLSNEKMAVVLQEAVGQLHDQVYYPHISGTAQSYNYYPISHMKPEDGFAVCAAGFGKYVVEGGKTYRFSPKYPRLNIQTPRDIYKNSQVKFLAIDMSNPLPDLARKGESAGLVELDIKEAERHGVLNHLASTYMGADDRLESSLVPGGPRVINFADILQYDYIPLSQTLNVLLDLVQEALGSPVEIEFAVDLTRTDNKPPSFYLLQIKPLLEVEGDSIPNFDSLKTQRCLLYSSKTMGNGKLSDLYDVVYVDLDRFDKTKTLDIITEIEALNAEMVQEGRQYILIGPGRWGTRDRFIGIPVTWPQISNAKVIVELGLPEFPLDASLGSHFFHNVTSMHVGYFSVQNTSPNDYLQESLLKSMKDFHTTQYLHHVRSEQPFTVWMDGKNQQSVILMPSDPSDEAHQ